MLGPVWFKNSCYIDAVAMALVHGLRCVGFWSKLGEASMTGFLGKLLQQLHDGSAKQDLGWNDAKVNVQARIVPEHRDSNAELFGRQCSVQDVLSQIGRTNQDQRDNYSGWCLSDEGGPADDELLKAMSWTDEDGELDLRWSLRLDMAFPQYQSLGEYLSFGEFCYSREAPSLLLVLLDGPNGTLLDLFEVKGHESLAITYRKRYGSWATAGRRQFHARCWGEGTFELRSIHFTCASSFELPSLTDAPFP